MYKVIAYFTDLQDNNHEYNVGDVYPREGVNPTPERISELAGNENKQCKPLIAEAETDIEKMKVAELQAYAKEKGIELDGVTKKEEILAKIKEAEAAK